MKEIFFNYKIKILFPDEQCKAWRKVDYARSSNQTETKNILKLIAEAGYDVSDEVEKRAGMKAYSFAVSVWSDYKTRVSSFL